MNKIKLIRKIINFTTNCVMAAMMFTLALNYVAIIWSGHGMVWLLICEIICFVGDIFCAANDWKEIKKMLEDDTNA